MVPSSPRMRSVIVIERSASGTISSACGISGADPAVTFCHLQQALPFWVTVTVACYELRDTFEK